MAGQEPAQDTTAESLQHGDVGAAEHAHANVPSKASELKGADIRAAAETLIKGVNMEKLSLKTFRQELCSHFGIPEDALDERKHEVREIIQAVVQDACDRKAAEDVDDLGEEDACNAKKVYLVTLPHPRQATSQDGHALKKPEAYSREEIVEAFLAAVDATNGPRYSPLIITQMAVFRESHADGHIHYHIAVLGSRQFRYLPVKRQLLQGAGLASHWSCTHTGYHSCVAYGYTPTPRKPLSELDGSPYTWARNSQHPPLEVACQPPVTAKATAERQEYVRRARAEKAKPDKFEEIDVWPLVVRENILAGPDAPETLMSYAKRTGGHAMVRYCFRNWPKLQELVARCWQIEKVEQYVARAEQSRMQILEAALEAPCICADQWIGCARELLSTNGIDESAWRAAMLHSMRHGRSKGTLVCHAGHTGNEGKSFLFGPLETVFGEDFVFNSPPKGGFPLLGLDRCRVALLDDWRFNEDIIGYPLQLLWFEGKPIIIARPQNQFSGHLKYTKDDPIFISTLMEDIRKVKGKKIECGDVAMMIKRLKIFEFKKALSNPVPVKPCSRCFSTFLLQPDALSDAAGHDDVTSGSATEERGTKRQEAETVGENPAAKRGCRHWSVGDVVAFLHQLELGHVEELFRTNGVDGDMLQDMSEDDLHSELGLTRLQARKVQRRFGLLLAADA